MWTLRYRLPLDEAIALIAPVVCVMAIAPAALGETLLVRLDGSGDFTRIQDAVEIAQPGDTVLVGPGRYTWTNEGPGDDADPPHGMIVGWVDRPTGVTYISEEGPENTILDAEGQSRVLFFNGNNTSVLVEFVLSGFTITGGVAPRVANRVEREGGGIGMHLVYPLIENCVFVDNEAEFGGGVWAGGVSSIEFRNCRFERNTALCGGGMIILNSREHTLVRDCTFIDNVAVMTNDEGGGLGGAIYCSNNVYTIEQCVFVGNQADETGAGFFSINSKPGALLRNSFRDNHTPGSVVGFYVNPDRFEGTSTMEFTGNLVTDNGTASALFIERDVEVMAQCNDLFRNFGGNWTGNALPFLGVDGNVTLDPMFCEEASGVWTVDSRSPVLWSNNDCGQSMGHAVSGGHECDPNTLRSFGSLKTLFANPSAN